MDAIPLVRVRYADSFAEQLNRLGAPTERLLNQVNLSEEALTFRDGFMPVSQLWRLTTLAAFRADQRAVSRREAGRARLVLRRPGRGQRGGDTASRVISRWNDCSGYSVGGG